MAGIDTVNILFACYFIDLVAFYCNSIPDRILYGSVGGKFSGAKSAKKLIYSSEKLIWNFYKK